MELSDLQRRILAAAAERILPSDDGPGAAETRVTEYVAAALGEERLWGWFPLFSRGLDRLESMACEAFEIGFADASPEQRDEVLRHLQELREPPLRHFFSQLIRLCVEGFVGQDGPGWRYLGYPPEEMEGGGCLIPTRD